MHRCKRIIEGKTYNTETATRLAGWDETIEEAPVDHGEHLYRNRFGAFFLYYYASDGPYGPEEGIKPLSFDEVRAWIETYRSHDADLMESIFGTFPEAGSKETKYTLRLPDSLHAKLAARAKENGQSLNAWMIRCLERCAEPGEAPPRRKAKS